MAGVITMYPLGFPGCTLIFSDVNAIDPTVGEPFGQDDSSFASRRGIGLVKIE